MKKWNVLWAKCNEKTRGSDPAWLNQSKALCSAYHLPARSLQLKTGYADKTMIFTFMRDFLRFSPRLRQRRQRHSEDLKGGKQRIEIRLDKKNIGKSKVHFISHLIRNSVFPLSLSPLILLRTIFREFIMTRSMQLCKELRRRAILVEGQRYFSRDKVHSQSEISREISSR